MGRAEREQEKLAKIREKQAAERAKLMGKSSKVSETIRMAQIAAGGNVDEWGDVSASTAVERRSAYDKLVKKFNGDEKKAQKAMEVELQKFGARPKGIRRWWT